jgi:pimeloyl-ACP methyl ester carboxylesterase
MPWLRSGEQFSTSPLDINANEVSRSAIYRPAKSGSIDDHERHYAPHSRGERNSSSHRRTRRWAGGRAVSWLSRVLVFVAAPARRTVSGRFRAVAPDMRGYGQSDRPDAMDQYTLLHLVGDIVGLVAALGVDRAAIAGHDWGATVAWHSALLRPDRFRAVIGLSVPFQPRTSVVPTSVMPRRDDAMFFQLYFQTPGVAEAELQRDVRATIAKLLYSASGDAPRPGGGGGDLGMVSHGGG